MDSSCFFPNYSYHFERDLELCLLVSKRILKNGRNGRNENAVKGKSYKNRQNDDNGGGVENEGLHNGGVNTGE